MNRLLETPTPTPAPGAPKAARLRAAVEVVVLAAVAVSPWALAAVHPASLFVLLAAVAVALVLWALVLVTERGFAGPVCPVLVCLAGLVLLGVWQLVPFSPAALAVVSPGTARTRAELTPAEPEALRGEPPVRAPATISFDPGATRGEVVKLLAVLGLFAVTRYAVASPESFRRCAVVCAANGAALSVFALAQRFSSPPNTVYWSFETQGSVFGPFVCKNHFPYYVNVCFGLGLGLLLGSRALRDRYRGAADRLSALGRSPGSLWLLVALALMLAANLYSLSRGGVVALAGAGVGCGVLAALSGRRGGGAAAVIVIVGLGLGLVGWFGSDAVGKRLGTLGAGDALDDGRRDVWARTLPLALRFPLWGTGQGTFATAEPQQRQPGDAQLITWEHAHNDYLEALVEGGAIQLALVLLAGGLVFRAGGRAFRAARSHADAAVALGGLFGLTAVALHSLADFGLHMPAIVALVTVLAAHLTAAGAPAERAVRVPGRGWAALPIVAACLVCAAVLPADGWRRARAEHYRLAAVRAEKRLPAGERALVVEYLTTAVAFDPWDSALRLRLADVRYEEYLSHRDRTGADARPALRDYLQARAMNPLLERPHARLAGGREHLDRAGAVANYLDRATQLRPSDAGLWYLAGLAHLDAGAEDRAWACWRNSLACSDAQLEGIVATALPRLGADGLLDRVLPAKPPVLVAVSRLPSLADRPAERVAVLARALALLDGAERAEEWHLRARLLLETGRPADAQNAYERAVAKAPERVEWRYELAQLCFDRNDLPAAAEHVRLVLRDRPDWPGASDLSGAVARARAARP